MPKKSINVDSTPVTDVKSAEKGNKRGTDENEAIEKVVNAKKQKLENDEKQESEKKEPENAKKVESSSSEESSESEAAAFLKNNQSLAKTATLVTNNTKDVSTDSVYFRHNMMDESDEKSKATENGTEEDTSSGESYSGSDAESSDEEVDSTPVTDVKSAKQGNKRGTDENEAIEKVVNAKKQKLENDEKQESEKKQPENAKKVESNSSEESFESEEAVKEKSKAIENGTEEDISSGESYSGSDSESSDEETMVQATGKDGKPSAETSKDDGKNSVEEPSKEKQANGAELAKEKSSTKEESEGHGSSDDETSDEESEGDDDHSLKTPEKKDTDVQMVDASQTQSKKSDLSTAQTTAAVLKNNHSLAKTAPLVSNDVKDVITDSVYFRHYMMDESDEKSKAIKNGTVEDTSSGESYSDSDSESSDEEVNGTELAKEKSSTKEESEGGDDHSLKILKKKDIHVKMVDASQIQSKKFDLSTAQTTPKMPTSQATGSKILFVGNLSFKVKENDVKGFFKTVARVVDVRLAKENGEFKGFGHVEFATAEDAQKALDSLNGKKFFKCRVNLDLACDRGPCTPNNRENNSYQKGGKAPSLTAFVKGFDKSLEESEIRKVLQNHFGSCGSITRVSIPQNLEKGRLRGIAYIDFKDNNGFNKALELDRSEVKGWRLVVTEAKPLGDDGGGSGARSGGRSGRRGGSGGSRSGRRRGKGGGGRGCGGEKKPNFSATPAGKKSGSGDA